MIIMTLVQLWEACCLWAVRFALSCAGLRRPLHQGLRWWREHVLEAPPSTGAAKWALCLVCLALPAAAAAAAMYTGSGIDSFVARRPPPALGSGVSLGEPLVAPPFVLASVVTFLLAAVGPGRAFRFTAVVVWCLEAGVGNGMRVPEHALPMTCAALALVLLAVFAARRAARWVRSTMMQRRSSARDLTCRFSIGGRWVSLPASARVVDLKTALLKAAVGDAKPPDGAEEVTAAKSWVLASNGKALKDSKTLLVIPPGASITLEVRQSPKRVSDGAKETCLPLCLHMRADRPSGGRRGGRRGREAAGAVLPSPSQRQVDLKGRGKAWPDRAPSPTASGCRQPCRRLRQAERWSKP